jgi:hypothetical protein
VSVAPWTASDEGYLQAYQWAAALAGGAQLPREATPTQLGPGEVAHARFAPVRVDGYFGEDKQYRSSFLLVGGPVGLALTGAASLARNASKKAEAERAAISRWHPLGSIDLVVTNQRLVVAGEPSKSFWYAETGPLQMAVGPQGTPAVLVQPAANPLLRLESPSAAVLYVFVHHLVDGRPPGVPLPPGLLDRAGQQGRLG